MKEALTKVLAETSSDDASVDRILAASFFRTRPMQAGTTAPVVRLEERRATSALSS
jgi:hypothetical protein